MMLKLDRAANAMSLVAAPKLAHVGIKEREDLQRLIAASPEVFFDEIGEELLLLGEEVPAWAASGERIDLVALARDGALAVIELKRGSDPRQLLQGIAYAAVVAKWPATKAAEILAQFAKIPTADAQAAIADHLNPDAGGVNTRQRVILVAEGFDPIVLATAEWLVEQHGVELRCYRLALHKDGTNEYLAINRVYPPEEALPPSVVPPPALGFTTWNDALANVQNEHVRAFFMANKDATADRQSFVPSRTIAWRLQGKRRFNVKANMGRGYAWQQSRFVGDIAFWTERVSEPASISPQAGGTALRFYLDTAEDFAALKTAVEGILRTKAYVESLPNEDTGQLDDEISAVAMSPADIGAGT